MDGSSNPSVLPCPLNCGDDAVSQGGSSYYVCSCGNEFDGDEVGRDGSYKDTDDGWDEVE